MIPVKDCMEISDKDCRLMQRKLAIAEKMAEALRSCNCKWFREWYYDEKLVEAALAEWDAVNKEEN